MAITPPQMTAFTLARASDVNAAINQGFGLVVTKTQVVNNQASVTVNHDSGYYPFVGFLTTTGYFDVANNGFTVQHTSTNTFIVTWTSNVTGTIIYK